MIQAFSSTVSTTLSNRASGVVSSPAASLRSVETGSPSIDREGAKTETSEGQAKALQVGNSEEGVAVSLSSANAAAAAQGRVNRTEAGEALVASDNATQAATHVNKTTRTEALRQDDETANASPSQALAQEYASYSEPSSSANKRGSSLDFII
ncbi:MAG: hypothetical protein P8176_00500 [Gammaproteobacteria bacterium]